MDGLIQKSSSVPEEFENEINRKNALRLNLMDGGWTKILMHARLVVGGYYRGRCGRIHQHDFHSNIAVDAA